MTLFGCGFADWDSIGLWEESGSGYGYGFDSVSTFSFGRQYGDGREYGNGRGHGHGYGGEHGDSTGYDPLMGEYLKKFETTWRKP